MQHMMMSNPIDTDDYEAEDKCKHREFTSGYPKADDVTVVMIGSAGWAQPNFGSNENKRAPLKAPLQWSLCALLKNLSGRRRRLTESRRFSVSKKPPHLNPQFNKN
jgi:hypothetical protein